MATKQQAMDVLDALADDLDDYRRRCLLGPFAGGPIFRSDFQACRENGVVENASRFLDEVAPRLMLAQRFDEVVRATRSIANATQSEFERLGVETSVSGLLDRVQNEIVTPTFRKAQRAVMGGSVLALAAAAVWLLAARK